MGQKLLVNLIVDRYINLELFYRKQETLPNGCQVWTGPKNNAGYGFIGFKPVDPETGLAMSLDLAERTHCISSSEYL